MVMPCGLTPVDGIDFVDRFYFSVYACARVRPTLTHPHTRTNQCTERCLRKTVRCSTNLSKEPCHFQNPTLSTCRTLLTEGGGALIQQVGNGSGSEQPSWRENWVDSQRREHLFAVHIQAAGCRRETSWLQKPHFLNCLLFPAQNHTEVLISWYYPEARPTHVSASAWGSVGHDFSTLPYFIFFTVNPMIVFFRDAQYYWLGIGIGRYKR